jgi:ATP-dependent DNA helicase RecG
VTTAARAAIGEQTPLGELKGIGPRRLADLERAGLRTVSDLLSRLPIRYEDRSHFQAIGSLRDGEAASVCGEVASCAMHLTRRRGFRIFEATVRDESGSIRAVWLNQPFMADVVRRGQRIMLFGEVERHARGGWQFTNPPYEMADDEQESVHTGRIVPVYERVGTLTPKMQRRLVFELIEALHDVEDPLPAWLQSSLHLPDRRAAIAQAHFPAGESEMALVSAFRHPAQVRLILEEFFLFQAGLLLRRLAAQAHRKPHVPIVDDRIRAAARAILPFKLTGGQKTALAEIVGDMQRDHAMNRLLQGDVGAGKTIVALLAALVAMENGLQVAFMAPTEILAEQHYASIRRLLAPSRFRVALLSGSTKGADRREVLSSLADGSAKLVVGTHALVQQAVEFNALGLAIVDEQHRFGVIQRAALRAKGWSPDVLVMTATPIPRTLALTVYGDLDVSVIRELPPGRTSVQTVVRPESERPAAYEFARAEVGAGRQVYVVYPLVEESSKIDLRAATEMADSLAQDVFPDCRVALLHGRLKPAEKERVMRAFLDREIDILVSTTVVEVGIDVPNASVMIVEHAERFGLAQLHQLRGRVGRGAHASHCVLLHQLPISAVARARLDAMVETTDGFVISERDLDLRGPGDFFGTRQAGAPTLRTGDLLRDHALMEDARRYALEALDRPADAPRLAEVVARTWTERFGLAGVG